jgi:hypothetical protein
LMIAALSSGQITARTGRYRIFPVTGTLFTAVGFVFLTFLKYDSPLWFLMIGIFIIGLGLGQLMQTLVLASQNSVKATEMGVASSAATFFRQIGGTLGTAIMLSVLFSVLPANIVSATGDKATLSSGLDAALNPTVATASENKAIMKQLWNPFVGPITANVQKELDQASAAAKAAAGKAVTTQVTAAVDQQVAAGKVPQAYAPALIQQQVAEATPAAESVALTTVAKKANASVVDGRVTVNWSNAAQRAAWVHTLTPQLQKQLDKGGSKASTGSSNVTSDTSFVNGADPRLSKPFMVGFTQAIVLVYWVGFGVILLAFILSWFFRVPPLRKTSALQEQADAAGLSETGSIQVRTA